MVARLMLLALTGLALIALVPAVSAGKPQGVSISAGGAKELGKTTVLGNPSINDFKANVNVSETSALLSWMQQLQRRQTVESPIVIQLENGQRFEFLEPKITNVDLSAATTATIEVKHREGMLRLIVPKKAWEKSAPPPKK